MTLLPSIRTPADLKRLPVEKLPELAQEIRRVICEQVSATGGHLAPNLGVVELTIALHYVFDFGHDRLLFDVGHQCYPHKLLTGRQGGFDKLRTSAGVAGFPEPNESPYDLFRVGHAGTAISTAVGMARGDALREESYNSHNNPDGRRVVSLIGDASIVNGVAMEGLNNAGTLDRQFLVVLNDNGMSIAKPQGAMARYFDRLRLSPMYTGMKRQAKQVLGHIPGGSLIEEAYHRAGEATKVWINEGSWFEHFGLMTVGPVDGHDLPTLIEVLAEAREFDRPMVLHVKTIKGKGYDFAEGDATCFHSPAPFDLSDDGVAIRSGARSFTSAFSDAVLELLKRDESVVAATAAMPDGTGLTPAIEQLPERVWDTGICESHAMDMLAGLAKTGFKPFFAVYSTFLQRAFDQAFQEVALQGLPVRLCIDRAGLVGGDGAVHHGFCDVALLRTLPDAAITAAIDEASLAGALRFMLGYEDGISAVRYPRDAVSDRFAHLGDSPPFELGKARHLSGPTASRKPAAAVLVFGALADRAMDAIESLDAADRVALYDARFAKPIDESLIRSLLTQGVPTITVEDHGLAGGFGAAVLESAASMGLDSSRVIRLGIPDHWIVQDSRSTQLARAGLDADSIAGRLREAISEQTAPLTEPKPIADQDTITLSPGPRALRDNA